MFEIDPLTDARWAELLERSELASVFHTRGWLLALSRTYGYKPTVFTTSGPRRDLGNAIACCRVRSWLTGRRIVSLPFSDHCDPLLMDETDDGLLASLSRLGDREGAKYIELRPRQGIHALPEACGFRQADCFAHHSLDLRCGLEAIFSRFHKDCIQRAIRRAERDKLVCESGRDEGAIRKFYSLMVRTRRRHGLPPQPMQWFRNLADCLGDAMQILIASREGRSVAGLLALTYKRSATYKYACSHEDFRSLGAGPFLLWQLISRAKALGADELDLGRSNTAGLMTFKERWGARRTPLVYWRSASGEPEALEYAARPTLHAVIARTPARVLAVAGSVLYRACFKNRFGLTLGTYV